MNRDPAAWPDTPDLDPSLATTAHSIRFFGADRYQTNLAISLALRGSGGFPFETPHPAAGWWGARTCPRSILVVAGDTFADALSAASLSDPTDQSDQPRVRRVAAADPLFDPVGGFDRVDTASAPIVVTTSARQGATGLAPTARSTAIDLNRGGCTTAREAIIVGGTGSVPAAAERELVSLGYEEVFRVSGDDRYGTAAGVAAAMGTEAVDPATPCLDPLADDGSTRTGFYGNAAIEYRASATECRVLPRTVVLADGGTGADALAAGWWTSHWQVPILLVAPDGSLPPATRTALQELDIDTIVVLGGAARIPEETVQQARELATAVAGRFAGDDRYQTSIVMAQAFGGWHPTGEAEDFDGDLLCLASSSGDGAAAGGWPDALAAGPWCGRAGAAALPGPTRALPPRAGSDVPGPVLAPPPPSHEAVPILIVPPTPQLPASVDAFLREAYASGTWCSAQVQSSCAEPGFVVAFGGPGGVSAAATLAVARRVAGGAYPSTAADLRPTGDGGFTTSLDMSPVFAVTGDGGDSTCFRRGGLHDVRWVAAPGGGPPSRDLVARDDFSTSAEGARVSEPVCLRTGSDAAGTVDLVSLSGHVGSDDTLREAAPDRAARPSELLRQPATSAADETTIQWTSSAPPQGPAELLVDGSTTAVQDAALDLRLRVGSDIATGSFTLRTASGDVFGTIEGGYVTGEGTEVRGQLRLSGAGPTRIGGFRATIDADTVVWTFDAYQ